MICIDFLIMICIDLHIVEKIEKLKRSDKSKHIEKCWKMSERSKMLKSVEKTRHVEKVSIKNIKMSKK